MIFMVTLLPTTFSDGQILYARELNGLFDSVNLFNPTSRLIDNINHMNGTNTYTTQDTFYRNVLKNSFAEAFGSPFSGSFINGSSTVKVASFTPYIDFKPTYEDFRSGSFPSSKAGSYSFAYAGSAPVQIIGSDTTYGSYCLRTFTNQNTHLGSIVFNGPGSSLTCTYPGSNLEFSVDFKSSLYGNTGTSINNSVSTNVAFYLINSSNGSSVGLYNNALGVSGNNEYTKSVTSSSEGLCSVIYNGTTGSFVTRILTNNYYNMSTSFDNVSTPLYYNVAGGSFVGSISTGSWNFGIVITGTSGGTNKQMSNTLYINRISHFTGSETGSTYCIYGPITYPGSYTMAKTTTLCYNRDLGSITTYIGRTTDLFPTADSGTVVGTGSTMYLKFVGEYSGSFDTTCYNAPFIRGVSVLTDCSTNKW